MPAALPALPCPFPGGTNPDMDEAGQTSFDWLATSGMVPAGDMDRARGSKYGWMAALTNPWAPPEGLRLITDWYGWLYAFDDGFCESDAGSRTVPLVHAFQHLLRALDGDGDDPQRDAKGHPIAPYARALGELSRRIAAAGSPGQYARWRDTVKEYLFAQVWEAANREADAVPGIDEYVFMRRATGAPRTCFALIEVAGGYRIAEEDWHDRRVRELSDLAADVIDWDNDLFSYEKEKITENARHNLVTVIMDARSCDVAQAMREVGVMHTQAINRFIAIKREITGSAGEGILRYIRGLEDWMRGNIDFSRKSMRYNR